MTSIGHNELIFYPCIHVFCTLIPDSGWPQYKIFLKHWDIGRKFISAQQHLYYYLRTAKLVNLIAYRIYQSQQRKQIKAYHITVYCIGQLPTSNFDRLVSSLHHTQCIFHNCLKDPVVYLLLVRLARNIGMNTKSISNQLDITYVLT